MAKTVINLLTDIDARSTAFSDTYRTTFPVYRTIGKYMAVRTKAIEAYKELPFNPDATTGPSGRTLSDLARHVVANDYVDFSDPDHLALLRISGETMMMVLQVMARTAKLGLNPPNLVVKLNRMAKNEAPLSLCEQVDLVRSARDHFAFRLHPMRTYEEIVELATSAPPAT